MIADLAIPGALNSPSGVCTIHGTMIFRNGLPHCLQCASAETQGIAGNLVGEKPVKAMPDEVNRPRPELKEDEALLYKTVESKERIVTLPLEPQGDAVRKALEWLRRAPMPKDLKMFKTLQKAISLLEKASAQEEN